MPLFKIIVNLPKEIPQGSLVVGQSLDADEIIVDNNSLKVSEKGHLRRNTRKTR